jgi:hypothetical protein
MMKAGPQRWIDEEMIQNPLSVAGMRTGGRWKVYDEVV